jgi:hypothetical protein
MTVLEQHFMHTASESFYFITSSDHASFTAMETGKLDIFHLLFSIPEYYVSSGGLQEYTCDNSFTTEGKGVVCPRYQCTMLSEPKIDECLRTWDACHDVFSFARY